MHVNPLAYGRAGVAHLMVVPEFEASWVIPELPTKDAICLCTCLVNEAVNDAIEVGALHMKQSARVS